LFINLEFFSRSFVMKSCHCLPLLLILHCGLAVPAIAQSITSAPDGTGTVVNQNGQRFNISGGSVSRDGANLFHSFQRFGLVTGETANFLTDPTIRNVLGRVVGGDPSVIQGLIQVSGSNANLFLMNPAGIIFGANAQLNVAGSFTATTATGIGFNGGWFNAIGTNDYAALTGTPNQFAFMTGQPGSIFNQGMLTVAPGQNVTLMGGTVINTGTITAPGGTITIAAIPGNGRVRVSQSGMLLNLEFDQADPTTASTIPFTPLSLPQLLTHSGINHADTITVNADGTVRLSGSTANVSPQPGTAIAAGTLTTAATTGGAINVLGDRVALLNVTLDASGQNGGGDIRIGGGYQGKESVMNASRVFVDANSTISANAIAQGNGGRVIVWSDQATTFLGQIGAKGGATGGDGGFVEVSGKEHLRFQGQVDVSAPLGQAGTLLLDPRNILISNEPSTTGVEVQLPEIFADDFAGEDITLNATTLENQFGNIILTATDDITIAPGLSLTFAPFGGLITFDADADGDGVGTFSMDTTQTIRAEGRSLTINAAEIIAGSLNTSSDTIEGGSVTLSATGDISAVNIRTGGITQSGDVTIQSQTGSIATGAIDTTSVNGALGNVALTAPGTITTGAIAAASVERSNNPAAGANSEDSTSGANSTDPKDALNGVDQAELNDAVEAIEAEFDPDIEDPSDLLDGDFEFDDEAYAEEFEDFEDAGLYVEGGEFLSARRANRAVSDAEDTRISEFNRYFGRDLRAKPLSPNEIRTVLTQIQQETNTRAAIIYVNVPKTIAPPTRKSRLLDTSAVEQPVAAKVRPLEILVFTRDREPIRILVPGVMSEQLVRTIQQFRSDLVTSVRRQSSSYLKSSQQLYQWLIAPIEAKMGPGFATTLLFSMDSGLRSLPIAALHDGKQFLIEKYSVGMTPAMGLTDPRYRSLSGAQVLAMGASTFTELAPLPAVPVETKAIAQLWNGKALLDQDFTRTNLVQQRQQTPFQIIHLATHAEFNPGNVDNSFIQLWNDKLRLNQLPDLNWNRPPVDLLVLSACRTAVGNTESELGFAGVAVASQVKSALASLWSVSDEGTLALMTTFYDELRSSKVKSEALRQAQLSMLRGNTRIQGGQLVRSGSGSVPLPATLSNTTTTNFSHPYFWSGFTMIGSPW